MIEFHAGPTPNSWKVSIMLEECGLPYRVHPVDILAGDQFKPEFLRINPNNKHPAIVDGELKVWESGAILFYLAEKTGRFLPAAPAQRYACMQWLMFQMAGLGPMFGQLHHFAHYAREKLAYPLERYGAETNRLRRVMDQWLADHEYFADEYSIADIACYPWIATTGRRYPSDRELPHLERWRLAIRARPAVQRGMALLADTIRPEVRGERPVDDRAFSVLFGAIQHRGGA